MTGQRKQGMGYEIYLVPPGKLRFQRHQVSGKGRLGRHFSGLIPGPPSYPQRSLEWVWMRLFTRNGGRRKDGWKDG